MCVLNIVNSQEEVAQMVEQLCHLRVQIQRQNVKFLKYSCLAFVFQGYGMLRYSVGQTNGTSLGVRKDSRPFPSFSFYLFTLL